MAIDLFVSNQRQVASPRRLVFFVDSPPREMQILSGIAIPAWDSQEKLDVTEVLVHFEQDAPPGEIYQDWDYTATVALAGIHSDEENFVFSTDECELRVHPDNRELMLWARIAVLGEPAHLNRFSYHVEVLSKIPIQGAIFGTIRWDQKFGAPHAIDASPMFKVGPATFNPGGGLGGGGGKAGWIWDSQFTVNTSVAPVKAGGEWAVPYSLWDLPLNQRLEIVPDLIPGALNGPDLLLWANTPAFAPSSRVITLTAAMPTIINADFEMTFPPGTH